MSTVFWSYVCPTEASADAEEMEVDEDPEVEMDTDEEEGDPEGSDEEPETRELTDSFTFTRVGQYVAVYYDDDFYIGAVNQIFTPKQAEVNFLTNSIVPNRYSWVKEDLSSVASVFVFAADFDLRLSDNARTWYLGKPRELRKLYQLYKKKYCL